MTPEQITLVEDSVRRVRATLPEVAAEFYVRLFAAEPDLRGLFPADLEMQQHKFADELDAIAQAIGDFPRFVERVRLLGVRHTRYGTRVSHYAQVRLALFGALSSMLGPLWTEELSAAWTAAYDMVAEVMMLGVDRPHSTLAERPL